MFLRFLLLSGILFYLIPASAQDVCIKNYSVNQGLSQSTVNALIQDKQGYLWIGTGHGLNRYNGFEFEGFFYNSTDSNSISNNVIRGLLDDTIRNVLWVGTEIGLNCYDHATGKFRNIFKGHPQFEKIYCSPLFYTSGELWFFSSQHGICVYHIEKATAEVRLPFRVNREVYYIQQLNLMAFQKENNFVYFYSIADGTLDSLKLPYAYPGYNTYSIMYFEGTSLLLFTEDGFYLTDHINNKIEEYVPHELLRHKNVLTSCTDHKGLTYYSVRDEGVYVFDKDKRFVKSFTDVMSAGSTDEYSFVKVRQLLTDHSGNVWAGTDGSGVSKISFSGMHFQPVAIKKGNEPAGYFNEFVRRISQVNDKLWVGTFSKGLFIINRNNDELKHVFIEPSDSSYITANTVNAMSLTSAGMLVGTDRGLYLADTANITFKKIPFTYEPAQKKIYDIAETKTHGILIASSSGLYRLSIKQNKASLSVYADSLYVVSRVFEDARGNVWLSYPRYGIKKLLSDRSLLAHTRETDKKTGMGDMTISCFAQGNGTVWASSSNGLWEFDEQLTILNHYDEQDGLCNNFIYGILRDTLGNFWLSTNKGVARFTLGTRTFRNYGLADGLRSLEHNSGAYYKSSNGDFYFGGIRGLSMFNPYAMQDNPFPPAVVLTRFNLLDNAYASADTLFSEKKVFNLSYAENTFSVEVAGLDFTNPNNNTYSFYLEGFDADFYNTGSKRFIRYSGLEPGTYTLWCKASNSDGVWSEKQKLFSIVITPPYWKTTWFRLSVVMIVMLLLSGTMYLIMQSRHRKQVQKLQRLQEIERIRLRISKDIHDEVGAGLTRIALMSEAAKIEHGDNINIGKKFRHVSETARRMTSGLHEIIWSVNPVYDNLESLLSYISNYAYEFFEDTEVNVGVNFPDHIPDMPVSPDIRRNLFLIVKEALNNSAKHSGAKNIALKCGLDQNNLSFEIGDDGKGFEPIAGGSKFSSGLKNMQRRAEEIRFNCVIKSDHLKGTSILLSGNIHSGGHSAN